MRKVRNVSNVLAWTVRSFAIVGLFVFTTNCTDQEDMVAAPAEAVVEEAQQTGGEVSDDATSLTVSGSFVEYTDESLCSECTYVIPEDASVVDGKKLDIKPGDVICLNSAFKYKAIELVNVEGTSSSPVRVANCN